MAVSLTNFLFEIINFLLLAAGLGWVLFQPVRKALASEQQALTAQRDEAAHDREVAAQLRAQTEADRASLHAALDAERAQQKAALERELQELRQQTHEELQRTKQAAQREALAARTADLLALSAEVGHLAARTVSKLLAQYEVPALTAALTQAAIRELEQQALAPQTGQPLVDCARPLSPEQETRLRDLLGSNVEFRLAEELQAGIRVVYSAGQLELTPEALARQAAVAATAESAAVLAADPPKAQTEDSDSAAARAMALGPHERHG